MAFERYAEQALRCALLIALCEFLLLVVLSLLAFVLDVFGEEGERV